MRLRKTTDVGLTIFIRNVRTDEYIRCTEISDERVIAAGGRDANDTFRPV